MNSIIMINKKRKEERIENVMIVFGKVLICFRNWGKMLVSSLSCEGHIAAVFLFLLWIVFVFIFIYLFIKMTNHLSP